MRDKPPSERARFEILLEEVRDQLKSVAEGYGLLGRKIELLSQKVGSLEQKVELLGQRIDAHEKAHLAG